VALEFRIAGFLGRVVRCTLGCWLDGASSGDASGRWRTAETASRAQVISRTWRSDQEATYERYVTQVKTNGFVVHPLETQVAVGLQQMLLPGHKLSPALISAVFGVAHVRHPIVVVGMMHWPPAAQAADGPQQ
jgi:hypothetical protein